MPAVTSANIRHIGALIRRGRNPAATVYDSIGSDFFLEPAPGWLNLGLWEGPGDSSEAPHAVHRLVDTLARELPHSGAVLDVGNGLGAQDLVIAEVVRPERLVALNITESQLRAGRARLEAADAHPVAGDAIRLPVQEASVDGVISVEAAFHFPSRARFFAEALRVLRPDGVLAFSDVASERIVPRTPGELIAGLSNLRIWGMGRANLATSAQIRDAMFAAGFVDVVVEKVGERVFPPAIKLFRERLAARGHEQPYLYRLAAHLLLRQWDLLYRRGMMEYLLVRGRRPPSST
ncbi:MAG: methyltransferase domain-containing protein [Actinomycetota bacterium]|nr:methyltransferase domain-containing protein [Actinomycetota bacterium]